MAEVKVAIQQLDAELPLPAYAHPGDAGMDLYARAEVTLLPGERALVATGIALAIPVGHVGLIHPRSGLAHRHGVTTVNAPGTIDAGYRGEVQVNLINLDPRESVTLRRGDRIAQLVVQECATVRWEQATSLSDSVRGAGGHGSSGGFGDPGPAMTTKNED
ncbi:dUTP diphosphatase [Calidifontibacter terrae]